MIDHVGSADQWRYAAAALALGVLFLLAVALRVHADRVPLGWRVVFWGFVLEQSVIAYGLVVRARSTPASFPDDRPDFVLFGVAASGLILVATLVGVFVSERANDEAPRVVC